MKLLTLGKGSPKLIKSDMANKGYLSAIMYLSPYKISGKNVCPYASPGCIASCLNTAGRGRTNVVQLGRLKRTKLFFENREEFFSLLENEIDAFVKRCDKLKNKPAIRLNGTSDIDWLRLRPKLFEKYNNVQFYDYTKSAKRYEKWIEGEYPLNYHLTFSRSELNHEKCLDFLDRGGTVAVVFRTKQLPKQWFGFNVFDADENDLRFLDYSSGVQGLYAKGKAKYDMSGFVVESEQE